MSDSGGLTDAAKTVSGVHGHGMLKDIGRKGCEWYRASQIPLLTGVVGRDDKLRDKGLSTELRPHGRDRLGIGIYNDKQTNKPTRFVPAHVHLHRTSPYPVPWAPLGLLPICLVSCVPLGLTQLLSAIIYQDLSLVFH